VSFTGKRVNREAPFSRYHGFDRPRRDRRKDAIKKQLEFDSGFRAIVSSGYSQDPIMAHYRDFGFMGVIAEPYKIRQMSEIVRKVLTSDLFTGKDKVQSVWALLRVKYYSR